MPDSHNIVSADTAQTIEDAVLFGHVKELDEVLDLIKDDDGVSEELRYGIEALRYFRDHYGRDGTMKPTSKLQMQQITVMETAWSAELLEMLRQAELSVKKTA